MLVELKQVKYPNITSFERKYLLAASTSVHSEILFSDVDNLYKQKRNHFIPKISEKLLFLHHNLWKPE